MAMREEMRKARQLHTFHVLPDCAPVLDLWQALQTQWRMGPMGPTGFDYAGVRAHPAVHAIRSRRKREELLIDVGVMEVAWLAESGRIAAEKAKQPQQPVQE